MALVVRVGANQTLVVNGARLTFDGRPAKVCVHDLAENILEREDGTRVVMPPPKKEA